MDRRSIIKNAGIAGVLAAGVAPAVHAQPTIRWRLTSSFPKVLDTLFGVNDIFAAKVRELSGGRFQITTHAPGELVPAFGTMDAIEKGTVEMANTAPYYYFGKDETFALACAIPFGMNSRQQNGWYFEGNGLKLMRDFYRQFNCVNFPMGNTGVQMGGWFRREIKSLAEFRGTKFRVGGFGGRIVERIGGVPQNIPGGEIYQALEKGTIDAAEWVGPYDDQKLGFVKVAPNYAYPGWWEGGAILELHINSKAWDSLTPEYKAIVECASAYCHTDMQAKYDGKNAVALKTLVSQGAKLFPFPNDMMEAAFRASREHYAELSARNPNWKRVYDDYVAFQRDSNLWFRFAESSYDNFIQRQRL